MEKVKRNEQINFWFEAQIFVKTMIINTYEFLITIIIDF